MAVEMSRTVQMETLAAPIVAPGTGCGLVAGWMSTCRLFQEEQG